MSQPHTLAYFISPHGFGHATRASAVMNAINKKIPAHYHIFTKVPAWLFAEPNFPSFDYHDLLTDIGLAQQTVLQEDIPETIRRLSRFMPFATDLVQTLAQQVKELGCQMILCDIAPLGLAVAQAAGIPSILLENFTWDWIYQGYVAQDHRLHTFIDYLQDVFATATYHVQMIPFCAAAEQAALTVPPVSRATRQPATLVRRQLGLTDDDTVVMTTMGGIPWHYDRLEPLEQQQNIHFIIPGGAQNMLHRRNLILLPHQNQFFHPDLVNACDAIIGKIGYSTLAEVYQAGSPFGYIPRPSFRESQILGDYIAQEMPSLLITDTEFQTGVWTNKLSDLLALERVSRACPNGSEIIADFVVERLDS